MQPVPHLRQVLPHLCGVRDQRGEFVGPDVPRELLAERDQAARPQFRAGEIVREARDRFAIDLRGIEEPGLLLIGVTQLLGSREMCAHRPHLLRERGDRPGERLAFEIPQHLLPVGDRRDLAERYVEEGLEVVFLAPDGDRGDDPIEIQIPEARRLSRLFDPRPVLGSIEEDATEPTHRGSRRLVRSHRLSHATRVRCRRARRITMKKIGMAASSRSTESATISGMETA